MTIHIPSALRSYTQQQSEVETDGRTLAELVSLAKTATLMVSGDTGPIHVAGAVGTPLVGIYGPTSPERNGPWASQDLTVSRFRNCECHYQRQCHAKRWCLLEVSPREVLDLIDQRLAAAGHV